MRGTIVNWFMKVGKFLLSQVICMNNNTLINTYLLNVKLFENSSPRGVYRI